MSTNSTDAMPFSTHVHFPLLANPKQRCNRYSPRLRREPAAEQVSEALYKLAKSLGSLQVAARELLEAASASGSYIGSSISASPLTWLDSGCAPILVITGPVRDNGGFWVRANVVIAHAMWALPLGLSMRVSYGLASELDDRSYCAPALGDCFEAYFEPLLSARSHHGTVRSTDNLQQHGQRNSHLPALSPSCDGKGRTPQLLQLDCAAAKLAYQHSHVYSESSFEQAQVHHSLPLYTLLSTPSYLPEFPLTDLLPSFFPPGPTDVAPPSRQRDSCHWPATAPTVCAHSGSLVAADVSGGHTCARSPLAWHG